MNSEWPFRLQNDSILIPAYNYTSRPRKDEVGKRGDGHTAFMMKITHAVVKTCVEFEYSHSSCGPRAHDAKLVFSLLTLARYRDLSDLLRSPIVSHVTPQMSFIA